MQSIAARRVNWGMQIRLPEWKFMREIPLRWGKYPTFISDGTLNSRLRENCDKEPRAYPTTGAL